MKISFYKTGVIFFCVFFIFPPILSADIGESIIQAKEKTAYYEKKYGAVCPFFVTNESGKIIVECWNAPPQHWNKQTAMILAKELVPEQLQKQDPKFIEKDGVEEIFSFSDGTKIVFVVFNNKCTLVGVYAPEYKGPTC